MKSACPSSSRWKMMSPLRKRRCVAAAASDARSSGASAPRKGTFCRRSAIADIFLDLCRAGGHTGGKFWYILVFRWRAPGQAHFPAHVVSKEPDSATHLRRGGALVPAAPGPHSPEVGVP